MNEMNKMDNDVVGVELNLISYLQQQIQLHTKVATLTIIYIIAYGLHIVYDKHYYGVCPIK